MFTKSLREWKKVFEDDLKYIVIEIQDLVDQPAMVFLDGNLGAGKTSFARAFLGEETTSPTYGLIHEVGASLHADFYRIKESSEIDTLEFELYLENKHFALIEWGLKYSDQLIKQVPEDYSFYELKISESKEKEKDFRHYVLSEVSFY